MKLFGQICKSDEQSDGTLLVEGYASAEVVDTAGETITSECIKQALPDYFRHGGTGPLREMHQKIAAGTVTQAQVQPDGRTFIQALVVDPVSIKKVQTGVLKGFSVGGTCLARDQGNQSIITKMRLTEISLVDRPCNPEAVITMYKADDSETEALADSAPEEDANPDTLPANLLQWLTEGAALLSQITPEQAAALRAALHLVPDGGATPSGSLNKVGQRNSAADLKLIQGLHDQTVKLGAQCCAADADDTQAEKLHRHADAKHAIQKAQEGQAIAKLEQHVQELTLERSDLQKRLIELEAQPQASRIALRAIDKTADSPFASPPSHTEVRKHDGSLDAEATTLNEIKRLHQAGARVLHR